MTIEIVKDEEAFEDFIEFLPNLEEGECYYVCLFARKKYHSSANNDKTSCKRFTATSKEWLEIKVRQLETKKGAYKNKDGTAVHEDALALYINVNPRSFKKAQKNLLIALANKITEISNYQNPSSLALSEIQRAKSRTVYVDFDFDTDKPYSHFEKDILNIINEEAINVIKTRGGFHVLVAPDKVIHEYKSNWYQNLTKFKECDVAGDNLIPFVGTRQGDSIPYLLREVL